MYIYILLFIPPQRLVQEQTFTLVHIGRSIAIPLALPIRQRSRTGNPMASRAFLDQPQAPIVAAIHEYPHYG